MKIVRENQLKLKNVNHRSSVNKKVILNNNIIPNLMMFSSATFKPSDSVDNHLHKTMFETFHILSGEIEFTVNNKSQILKQGDTITIEPNEIHSLKNISNTNVELIYFGIASDK